jgi:hypothetical protein
MHTVVHIPSVSEDIFFSQQPDAISAHSLREIKQEGDTIFRLKKKTVFPCTGCFCQERFYTICMFTLARLLNLWKFMPHRFGDHGLFL